MVTDINNPDYIFQCSLCKELKPNREFYKKNRLNTIRKYRSDCKHCCSIANKLRKKDPVKERERKLRQRFGIDSLQYASMFMAQKGKCAICGIHESLSSRRLCVDHCHVTMRVRGLLCHTCNAAVGLLGDNPRILMKAIDYLNKL